MATIIEIRMPDIGGAANVEVIEVFRAIGDKLEIDDELISVETDKATMEIPAPSAGILKELKVGEGSKVSEGDLIALLEIVTAAGDVTAAAIDVPGPTERVSEVRASAPQSTARQTEVAKPAPLTSPAITANAATSEGAALPYASPSIRKLARELLVPIGSISGTGAKGRISRQDVYSYVKNIMSGQSSMADAAAPASGGGFADLLPWPKVDFAKFGPVQRRQLSRIQKISGANLHRNWVTIPHVTNHEDADITDLEAFRQQLNEENKKAGIKVTLLAFLVKASVAALKKFPEFNASLDGQEIILKGYYNIGFAADTPNGLVVPVIRDVDKKGVLDIVVEMSALAEKAREGKLSAADMSGGCFSISSLGGIGGTYFTPIINAPEVAIMGVGKSRTQMIWNGEKAEPRLILPLSLSWDHRVVDGAVAGRFNAYLASLLTDFRRIIL
ncbi:dihydrolipoyllysine-residue acetyltransferase [Pseudomaricurvus alcaniphilus]|uniref:dihydrolipoyllysine-residue acetyltransferase n=1 Tax=Pseudomaricurvus alcaniphilus TaxID=1166482 RepID=UPI00140C6669|nr:dihydrolipoyllysine-residue acetyltransferase [Pseudomaricurvus alcaniphilus]NHN36547.1 dihydrolipoyllysine-residue acetyltransferase [Pseudomaricurvus alcaniphilus]